MGRLSWPCRTPSFFMPQTFNRQERFSVKSSFDVGLQLLHAKSIVFTRIQVFAAHRVARIGFRSSAGL